MFAMKRYRELGWLLVALDGTQAHRHVLTNRGLGTEDLVAPLGGRVRLCLRSGVLYPGHDLGAEAVRTESKRLPAFPHRGIRVQSRRVGPGVNGRAALPGPVGAEPRLIGPSLSEGPRAPRRPPAGLPWGIGHTLVFPIPLAPTRLRGRQ